MDKYTYFCEKAGLKKIAIIVQRYGVEVNGGAEYHARMLAEKLAKYYAVEIVTTCAKDHGTWANEYPQGAEIINGVTVHRFKSAKKNQKKFRKNRRMMQRGSKSSTFNTFCNKIWGTTAKDPALEWLKNQGPYCPDLVNYISKNKDNYHTFIFFTYLYYPTVMAMPLVKEKSIFIPTAHNEETLFFFSV